MDFYQIWHKRSPADEFNCADFFVDRFRGVDFVPIGIEGPVNTVKTIVQTVIILK